MSLRNLPAIIVAPDVPENPENRAPDCVSMELEGAQVDESTVELRLSIAFGQQDYRLNRPRLCFAVQGGEVRLQIEGGKFHHPADTPGQMPLTVGKKVVAQVAAETSASRKRTSKLGLKAAAAAEGSANWEGETQTARKDTLGRSEETSYAAAQVQPLLNPRPGWRFTNRTDSAYLQGSVIEALGGTCTLTGGDLRVTATFHVRDRDVVMRASDGFDSDVLTACQLKFKLGRRLLFRRLIQPKCEPYLSRVVLSHE